jgi:hypothetical protein
MHRSTGVAIVTEEPEGFKVGQYRLGKVWTYLGPSHSQHVQTIGKGNFAKVKLARHNLTDVEVAVKIVDKTNMNEATLEKVCVLLLRCSRALKFRC